MPLTAVHPITFCGRGLQVDAPARSPDRLERVASGDFPRLADSGREDFPARPPLARSSTRPSPSAGGCCATRGLLCSEPTVGTSNPDPYVAPFDPLRPRPGNPRGRVARRSPLVGTAGVERPARGAPLRRRAGTDPSRPSPTLPHGSARSYGSRRSSIPMATDVWTAFTRRSSDRHRPDPRD